MPKSLDEMVRDGVRDVLGNQILQIVQLQAENELLKARIVELQPVASAPEAPG